MKNQLRISLIACAAVLLVLTAGTARADPMLSVTDTVTGATVNGTASAGPVTVTSVPVGVNISLTSIGGAGGFFVTSTNATVLELNPTLKIDLGNSVTGPATGGGVFTSDASVTGVPLAGLPGTVNALLSAFTGSLTGSAGQTIEGQLKINGTVVADTGTITSTGGVFSIPAIAAPSGSAAVGGTTFDADLVVIWNLHGGTGTLFLSQDSRGDFTATPEPSTLASALFSLPVLGIGVWRRGRAKAKA